jgi:hypothetical protein
MGEFLSVWLVEVEVDHVLGWPHLCGTTDSSGQNRRNYTITRITHGFVKRGSRHEKCRAVRRARHSFFVNQWLTSTTCRRKCLEPERRDGGIQPNRFSPVLAKTPN